MPKNKPSTIASAYSKFEIGIILFFYTVKDLIQIIFDNNLVSTEYNFMTENCKHFAQIIYNGASQGSCTVFQSPFGLSGVADLPHVCERGG